MIINKTNKNFNLLPTMPRMLIVIQKKQIEKKKKDYLW